MISPNYISLTVKILMAIWLVSPCQLLAEDIEFSATIKEIHITKKFNKETILAAVDPRFFISLKLDHDAEGIGKRGDTVNFAIHSPSRDLRITDQQAAIGTSIHLRLSSLEDTDIRILRWAPAK